MRRRRLFWKYTTFFVLLVTAELLASGITELYFSYQENQAALVALQREKALAAASQIEGFIKEIEQQMGWVTQPQRAPAGTTLEQRRFDFFRLQRQVPAITEVSYIDAAGREQLRVSRLAMDAIGSQADLSADPRFVEAKARKVYRGPVYFRKESEPYMVIAIAEGGQARRGHRGRGEPQVHLGRGLPDQDRQGGPGLRGGRAGRAHRASGHQPGAPEDGSHAARPGEGRAGRPHRSPARPRRKAPSPGTCATSRC